MFAMIILAGIRMLSGAEQTRRSGLIIAVSLGCGLAVTVRPDLLSKMPAFVREVFGSGITVGALVAVGLNLLLPGREFDAHEEELESATVAPVATSSAAA